MRQLSPTITETPPTTTETPPTTTETPPTDHLFPVVSLTSTTEITSASTYSAAAASTAITAWPQVSIPDGIFEETFRRSSAMANYAKNLVFGLFSKEELIGSNSVAARNKQALEKDYRLSLIKDATFKKYCIEDKINHGLCAEKPSILPSESLDLKTFSLYSSLHFYLCVAMY